MPQEDPILDDLDRRILNILQVDASQTNAELAESVHISPPTCLRRVKQLRENGVIERQVAIVAPDKVGARLSAIVEITLDVQAADRMAEFERVVADEAAVLQCYRAGFRARRAGGRHAGISRPGTPPVHHAQQCAQRQSLLFHIPQQVRNAYRRLTTCG